MTDHRVFTAEFTAFLIVVGVVSAAVTALTFGVSRAGLPDPVAAGVPLGALFIALHVWWVWPSAARTVLKILAVAAALWTGLAVAGWTGLL